MTNKTDSAERVIARNAQAGDGATTQAPLQTVAHGMAVEARLVQAIAARKKKERSAGGKSAAELAESILAGGLEQSRSSPEGVREAEFSGHDEDVPAATPSGLEFLEADELSASTLDDSPRLSDDDDALSELFGEPAQADPVPAVIDQEREPQENTDPVPLPAAAVLAAPTQGDKVPENRDRLKNLLREISGKS